MFNCRICGQIIEDMLVLKGISRCYSCLNGLVSACRESERQAKKAELYRRMSNRYSEQPR